MDNFHKSLPKGCESYENQVAGHAAKDGTSPTGILKHNDGSLLKPLVKEPQSQCEVDFYERINSDDGKLKELKEFLPQYRGTVTLRINNKDVKFLKLEDITMGSVKPCVMDVKIGAQTWAPDASQAKRENEDRKYMNSKKAYGFCILGYKVYNLTTGKLIKFGKEDGKRLTKNDVPEAFKEFFNHNSGHLGILIDCYLPTIRKMMSWWKTQNVLHIYSSSLLFFYDAYHLEVRQKNKIVQSPDSSWVKVSMIDFAHVVPATDLDLNYINGLKRLIELLEQLRLEYK